MSNAAGLFGYIFGTGENAPVNTAIFVIVLCAVMALMVTFFKVNIAGITEGQMLANLRETALMALAYLFGRTGKNAAIQP